MAASERRSTEATEETTPTPAPETTYVQRSATVGMKDSTLADFTEAAAKVGAPSDARVSSGGGMMYVEGQPNLPYTATFTWTETQ